MVAAKATSDMPMATMNSISVNPICFFMISSLPPSSRKRRDVADERVGTLNTSNLVVYSDGDLPEIRFSSYGGNGNRPGHPGIQVDNLIVRRTQDPVRARPDDDGIRKGRVVVGSADQAVGAGVEQRLSAAEEHAVLSDVLDLRPGQNLGIARREDGFHGLFRLLFRNVIVLRKAGVHDALRVNHRQRKHTEGKDDDGDHRLDQREAGWMTRDFALSFH